MRIITWNINGQRTLRGYRPWYSMKSWAECLDHLEADLICFQEVKMTRKALLEHRDMCLPQGYEAYYSLHPTKGYSGVSTFVKADACHAARAEQGLTGELVENRRGAANATLIGGYPDERAAESPLYDVIDAEGRAVLVDCGLFVLFNLYCPNETDEGRRDYKMAYYHTLAERVDNLRRMGREVIIVGDLNIAHLPIDHCEGVGQRTRDQHLDIHPARRWLDSWLAPKGDFHDVTRMHHPTRKFMYTCWDTVKDTRPCNYGVRIDYVFVSGGLLPWVKYADIQPNVFGSDHCPVFVDLHDVIDGPDGTKVHLKDMVNPASGTKRKMPALATSSWPEVAGRRIQSFFTASSGAKTPHPPSPVPIASAEAPSIGASASVREERLPRTPALNEAASSDAAAPAQASTSTGPRIEKRERSQSSDKATSAPSKAFRQAAPRKSPSKPNDTIKPGQMRLQSFFTKPSASKAASEDTSVATAQESANVDVENHDVDGQSIPETSEPTTSQDKDAPPLADMLDEADSLDETGAQRVESALAWGSIFAPKEPPRCTMHNEPARPWTVNKAGPNHGRKFWMCARPVGDAGTGDPADNQPYRCSFWKWDSDIRKRQRRQDRDLDGSAKSFHDVAGKAPRLASGERRGPEKLTERAMHKSVVPRDPKAK